MKHRRLLALSLLVLPLLATACIDGTEPMSTRGIEERYLGMGESQQLYNRAQHLLRSGYYREAMINFQMAEMQAYTDELRQAARIRRLWLQEVVVAYENGQTPPPPPVAIQGEPPYGTDGLKPVIEDDTPVPTGRAPRDPDGQVLLPPLKH